MKNFCIVGYNFGEKYLSFIPIYIYSVLKSYPNYEVLIFTDVKLDEKTNKMLKVIENMGRFRIYENYDFNVNFSKNNQEILPLKQSVRWLFYDETFSNYEYIYIGDIDIFICKEEPDLLTQHIKHSNYLDLPYSNYVRISAENNIFNLKNIIYLIYTKQFKLLKNKFIKKPIHYKRLTGLHFIEREKYYKKIKPLFPKYIKKISNQTNNKYKFDEEILYDIVKDSGLGMPPISPNSPDLDWKHFDSINFRPHHGIHLGIFRNDSTVLKQKQVLDSYVYREYYKQINRIFKNDEKFEQLLSLSSMFVKNLFEKAFEYYEGKVDD